MPHLLALTGPAGSGKSFCADIMVSRYGFKRVRFADPLKRMLSTLLVQAGCPQALVHEYIDGNLKEVETAYLGGRSPRHAMQTLGTEWGRICIEQNLWVNITMHQVTLLLSRGKNVVIDDCRFASEAVATHKLGGAIVDIIPRRNTVSLSEHISEAGLPRELIDHEINNTGNHDNTERSIVDVLNKIHNGRTPQ